MLTVTSDTIFHADINDSRLQFAKNLGADTTLNVSGLSPREATDKIRSLMPAAPAALLECSGADSSYQMGLLVSVMLLEEILLRGRILFTRGIEGSSSVCSKSSEFLQLFIIVFDKERSDGLYKASLFPSTG